MTDIETTEDGDDGAVHHFWAFIFRRMLERRPNFDLEDPAQLAAAVQEFEDQ